MRSGICILLICWFSFGAFSQQTKYYKDQDRQYYEALNLFDLGQYGEAQQIFQEIVDDTKDVNDQFAVNSEYYVAICAIKLYNKDADNLITGFVYRHPESSMVNKAYLEMGMFRTRQKKFEEAVEWFAKVDKRALTSDNRFAYYFKYGYSLFMTQQYEQAKLMFYEIKDKENDYSAPAKYYYGHIAYAEGNYQTALENFVILENDESFAPLVPYYRAHILYLKKDYDAVIDYVPGILEKISVKRAPEMQRIVADSYYQKKEYDKAVPYIEEFIKKVKKAERSDYFLAGFIYYKSNKIGQAIKYFRKVTVDKDSLSQSAYYNLADCYLKSDDKTKALAAFKQAASINADPMIREESMFFSAKLAYELNYTPFNESIEALEAYIKEYPKSKRTEEAYNLMVTAFMNTRNYKRALEVLNNMPLTDHNVKAAFQRTTYFRGIELFNNMDLAEAIQHFDLSMSVPGFDPKVRAMTYYWRGEAYYRLKEFDKAQSDYKDFLITTGAYGMKEYYIAHYNLGYCNFKLRRYNDAISWFRKYQELPVNKSEDIYGDACSRAGDCFFLMKRYWMAIEHYDKTIKAKSGAVDYALYQKGFAFGLVARPAKKIATLDVLIRQYPESSYIDDALYEKGRTLMAEGKNQEAKTAYTEIVERYQSTSSFYKKSLVQLGLINYNEGNNDAALEYYKRVVGDFRGTREARNALVGIRNIYVETNKVNEYVKFVENVGEYANVSMSERDSLTYSAAERAYMEGKTDEAKKSLLTYVSDFENGNFIINAGFYLADIYHREGDKDNALKHYNTVIKAGRNDFTDNALYEAAAIEMYKKNYKEAYANYVELEKNAELNTHLSASRIGAMESSYNLNMYNESVVAADKVIHTDKIAPEMIRRAHYIKASSYSALYEKEKALDEYKWLSKDVSNEEGAEARYRIAQIYFSNNKLEDTEKVIMDFAKNNTPHQYWLAQSFILLSDIYVQKEDLFQAKATLQSVIDGYSVQDDGVIDLANSKLLTIIKAEKAKLNKKGDEIELHFKNVDKREVEKLNKENEASDSLLVKNATGTEEKSTAMKVD